MDFFFFFWGGGGVQISENITKTLTIKKKQSENDFNNIILFQRLNLSILFVSFSVLPSLFIKSL
jgi:hypothetical protein